MIQYIGQEKLIEEIYNRKQEHVFQYWQSLSDENKNSLMKELQGIDFDLMEKLFQGKELPSVGGYSPAPTIDPSKSGKEEIKKARDIGEKCIRGGKVAAFLVAGGQGSRLGYDGPKGKFPVGPVSGKSLFHYHGEKIKAYELKYKVKIPYLIMTSVVNHDETVAFFKENSYFGLAPELVMIFPQNMIPSLDTEGKLIMKNESSIFMNPDGHGGSLRAMESSGALKKIREMGIEIVSYFQVDNPLVKIVDPLFLGFHIMKEAEVSSKAIPKAYAEEKTGVFIKNDDGRTGIIEYSDMPEEKLQAKDDEGKLLYSAGNTAIHLINLDFIERVTGKNEDTLPYHRASKKIKAFINGGVKEIDGLKYEKFIFDALPVCKKDMVYETVREEEFAPVKNSEGKDSPQSAKELISGLSRKWLIDSGINIPEKVKTIEISPLFSVDGENIPKETVILDKTEICLE